MNRREFVSGIAVSLLTEPLAAVAQPVSRIYRIGLLDVVPATENAANLAAFRRGLAELGYVEGRNVLIEYRSAGGQAERFPDLATEMVQLKVDLIVTRGTPAALAAKRATRTIPIVMASSGDPLATGIAASLAHPGANVTGLGAYATELQGKQVEILREIEPRLVRVAFLYNMSNPVLQAQWKEAKAVARTLQFEPQLLDVRSARDLIPALDSAASRRVGAVVVAVDALIQAHRYEVVDALTTRRLPASSRDREFAEAGGCFPTGSTTPTRIIAPLRTWIRSSRERGRAISPSSSQPGWSS